MDIPRLAEALSDKSEDVRRGACKAMRWMYLEGLLSSGSAQVAVHKPILVSREDIPPSVRSDACDALSQIGFGFPGTILPALIQAMKDQDEGVRASGAVNLGLLGDKAREAVPIVIDVLRDADESPIVRSAAAFALPRIGCVTLTANDVLTEALNEENKEARQSAIDTLMILERDAPALDAR